MFSTSFGSWAPGVVWSYSKSKHKVKKYTQKNSKLHNSKQNCCLSWVSVMGLWTSRPRSSRLKLSCRISLLGTFKGILYTSDEVLLKRFNPYEWEITDCVSNESLEICWRVSHSICPLTSKLSIFRPAMETNSVFCSVGTPASYTAMWHN